MKKAQHSGAGGKFRESDGAGRAMRQAVKRDDPMARVTRSSGLGGGAKKTGTKAGMGMRVDSTAVPLRSGTKAGGATSGGAKKTGTKAGMGMRVDESSRPLSSKASYQDNLQSYSRRKRK